MKNFYMMIVTAAILLLCALSARYVTDFWVFHTFASFQIQGAAVALILSGLSLLVYRNLFAPPLMLISIAIAIHGYLMLGEFRQATPQEREPLFKLLSMNIRGDNDANRARIADYIIGSGADVVFVQESAPIGPEIARIKIIYPYRLGCGALTITCDQSIWSKRPLIDGLVKTASPLYRDRLMMATVDFGGKKVRFANVHLTKPYFDNLQAIELKRVLHFIGEDSGPLVLAGDFNASILTPPVRNFLAKAKLMTAEHEPATWPVGAVAIGMAIDHVLVRDSLGQPAALRILDLKRVPDPLGSNHYGLLAGIAWEDPSASYPPL